MPCAGGQQAGSARARGAHEIPIIGAHSQFDQFMEAALLSYLFLFCFEKLVASRRETILRLTTYCPESYSVTKEVV
jgi:hypothetical protein